MPENELFEEKLKRRLYDHENPHGRPLFDTIYTEIAHRKSVQRKKYFLAAASVLLASVGLFLFTFIKSNQEQIAVTTPKPVQEVVKPVEKITIEPVASETPVVKQEKVTAESQVISKPASKVSFTASVRNQKHILPDGSVISLEKGSSVSYSSEFGKSDRAISLLGIAFFEVEKNKELPFIVSTDLSKTTVTGTSFNIISIPGREEIQVLNGSVNYSTENALVKLKAGMSATLEAGGLVTEETISENALAWKTGKLVFKKESVANILADLELFWGKKIEISNPNIGSCTFTGAFTNPDVNQVMQVIALTMDLKWEETENSIILTGNGCK